MVNGKAPFACQKHLPTEDKSVFEWREIIYDFISLLITLIRQDVNIICVCADFWNFKRINLSSVVSCSVSSQRAYTGYRFKFPNFQEVEQVCRSGLFPVSLSVYLLMCNVEQYFECCVQLFVFSADHPGPRHIQASCYILCCWRAYSQVNWSQVEYPLPRLVAVFIWRGLLETRSCQRVGKVPSKLLTQLISILILVKRLYLRFMA